MTEFRFVLNRDNTENIFNLLNLQPKNSCSMYVADAGQGVETISISS